MLLLLAAFLPCLIWDGSPEEPAKLGIERICRPDQVDANAMQKLVAPGVQYRENEATSSRSPWLDANGWRFVRNPKNRFLYEVKGREAELAVVETFAYSADTVMRTDAAGMAAYGQITAFLKNVPAADLPIRANIGVVEDGSAEAGELMNLLARHNLLYRVVNAPDAHLDVNVKIGTNDYPNKEAADASLMSHKVRSQLGDERRLMRIYGSEVVVGRLLGDQGRARIHLINYSKNSIEGLRVRVKGSYARNQLYMSGAPAAKLEDYEVVEGSTEFTIATMNRYAVIDLFAR
ncbi:MAG: hypothetical protein JO022_12965 [Acidobacteriaceae bacterium]|nr:hypothetical protein [Acidobacteriaceae bacterium]